MNRKTFLKSCGMVCLGGISISSLLESCSTAQYYAASDLEGSYLKVAQAEFNTDRKGQSINRKFVLVKSEQLKFPIYLYKQSESEYTALWMECTHQGAELSAHGDYLSCPAHGSEFNHIGDVTQGPAQQNLRKLKTSIQEQFIMIHLS